jgi:hypothetical protein
MVDFTDRKVEKHHTTAGPFACSPSIHSRPKQQRKHRFAFSTDELKCNSLYGEENDVIAISEVNYDQVG